MDIFNGSLSLACCETLM